MIALQALNKLMYENANTLSRHKPRGPRTSSPSPRSAPEAVRPDSPRLAARAAGGSCPAPPSGALRFRPASAPASRAGLM